MYYSVSAIYDGYSKVFVNSFIDYLVLQTSQLLLQSMPYKNMLYIRKCIQMVVSLKNWELEISFSASLYCMIFDIVNAVVLLHNLWSFLAVNCGNILGWATFRTVLDQNSWNIFLVLHGEAEREVSSHCHVIWQKGKKQRNPYKYHITKSDSWQMNLIHQKYDPSHYELYLYQVLGPPTAQIIERGFSTNLNLTQVLASKSDLSHNRLCGKMIVVK